MNKNPPLAHQIISIIKTSKLYYRTLGFKGLVKAGTSFLLKRKSYITVSQKDVQFPINLRMLTSDVPTYKQIYLDGEYAFNADKYPEVILDVGANIGLASIYFANKFPKARIIAIEPETSNFEVLKKNVSNYSNVTPVHAALWNESGEINLVDPGLGNWGFMTEEGGSSQHGLKSETVSALTINDIMNTFNIDKIDILKIDIEGAEKEVFMDADSWLPNVDSLIVELHERMKSGCNRSFYNATKGFEHEWHLGENVYLSRGIITKSS